MTRAKLFTVLLAVVALPLAARAADPGVFQIPGTDSTIKFYGYAQLDTTLDFSGRPVGYENADWATFLPGVPLDNSPEGKRVTPQTYMTVRTSRFGLQTSTPSSWGPIGVRLEGDFNAPNGFQSETFTNSVLFRVRHAYGTVGNLLAGQTWSTFLDLNAAPDTVDFNGPGDLALVRNPMLRYTFGLAPGMTLALAAENTRGPQYGVDARFQTLPDIHLNFGFAGPWGTVSLRGVTQRYNRAILNGAGDAYVDVSPKSTQSFAGAISGSFKFGGDTLVAQFAGGPGVGRYLLNSVGAPWVSMDAAGDLKLWSVYAYHVGFTHVWQPAFRSNVVWSQTFIQDPKINGVAAAAGSFEKDMMQLFINTFWSFAKNAEFGVEYVFGQYKMNVTGDKGTQNRINASLHYNFF